MTTVEPPIAHLTQQELSDNDKRILAGLEDWLSQVGFDSQSHICTDQSLGEKWALLCEMDLIKKVRALLQGQSFNWWASSSLVQFIRLDVYQLLVHQNLSIQKAPQTQKPQPPWHQCGLYKAIQPYQDRMQSEGQRFCHWPSAGLHT